MNLVMAVFSVVPLSKIHDQWWLNLGFFVLHNDIENWNFVNLNIIRGTAKNRVKNYMRKWAVGEKFLIVRTVNGYFLIFFVRNQTEIVVLPNGANGMRLLCGIQNAADQNLEAFHALKVTSLPSVLIKENSYHWILGFDWKSVSQRIKNYADLASHLMRCGRQTDQMSCGAVRNHSFCRKRCAETSGVSARFPHGSAQRNGFLLY